MRHHWRRGAKSVHNSDYVLKLALRSTFVNKVEADTCFDLFAGTGTYCQAIYRDRFCRVVAVEKLNKHLADYPQGDSITAYQGDNTLLAPGLCAKHGFPDFIDADAFGNPDAPILRMLPWLRGKERFALVATDGTWSARTSFVTAPQCWGYGDVHWSPCSVSWDDYPVLIYRHWEEWFGKHGYGIEDFEWHRPTHKVKVVYYGLVAVKQSTGTPYPERVE